jgi:pyruvate/2-oxoglutarate/acetoin dehydrogenase E1 component
MRLLSTDPRVIFIGQNVACPGNVIFDSLDGVPMGKRLELPVVEELQMGMSIGLSLMGYVPVSIYPRMDFLLLAMNQLVNHLDKIALMSKGGYKPKVIIRTKVGSKIPLDAGLQHTQDYTEAMRSMLTTVNVVKLTDMSQAVKVYCEALKSDTSTLVVEVW